jgi:excisionase family DNA binding protein
MADLTLRQAAAELGVAEATLRWQVRNGKLKATKVGPVWTVTRREVERYRRDHLRGQSD